MKGLDVGAFRALGTGGPPRAYLAILVLFGHLGLMSFTGLSALVGTFLSFSRVVPKRLSLRAGHSWANMTRIARAAM